MKYRTIIVFRILMLLYLVAVGYLCFHNFEELPDIGRKIFEFEMDKFVHFCMFFPFPFLAMLCFRRFAPTFWEGFSRTVTIFVVGCAFAAVTEMVQTKLVWRCGDFRDLEADMLALGISCVMILVAGTVQTLKKRHA